MKISSNSRIILFGFLAYFWSLIDDQPVNADQLLGNSGSYVMEAGLHALTILFLYFSLREAFKGGSGSGRGRRVASLGAVAFLWSSGDDFTLLNLAFVELLRHYYWYPMDVTIHIISLAFFCLAVREARRKSGQSAMEDPSPACWELDCEDDSSPARSRSFKPSLPTGTAT